MKSARSEALLAKSEGPHSQLQLHLWVLIYQLPGSASGNLTSLNRKEKGDLDNLMDSHLTETEGTARSFSIRNQFHTH